MKCYRCGNPMVYQEVYTEFDRCDLWRCVVCGDYVDQVILANRQYQEENRKRRKRRRRAIYRFRSSASSM